MKWIFKKPRTNPSNDPDEKNKYIKEYSEGLDVFKIGRKLYSDIFRIDRCLLVEENKKRLPH
jgi:hypothetical protein